MVTSQGYVKPQSFLDYNMSYKSGSGLLFKIYNCLLRYLHTEVVRMKMSLIMTLKILTLFHKVFDSQLDVLNKRCLLVFPLLLRSDLFSWDMDFRVKNKMDLEHVKSGIYSLRIMQALRT